MPTHMLCLRKAAAPGGLLMGAIDNLRPDLYAGIVAERPFVDVITTMSDPSVPLTTGEYDEWGVSILWVWIIAVGLFVIGWALQNLGHQVFERKRPTLLDIPVHMLISPMYIFAKLFIALGFRPDLAAVLQKSSEQTALGSPPYPVEASADVDQTA